MYCDCLLYTHKRKETFIMVSSISIKPFIQKWMPLRYGDHKLTFLYECNTPLVKIGLAVFWKAKTVHNGIMHNKRQTLVATLVTRVTVYDKKSMVSWVVDLKSQLILIRYFSVNKKCCRYMYYPLFHFVKLSSVNIEKQKRSGSQYDTTNPF